MHDLPVMLRVAGRRCVVVGGGAVAARRCRSLVEAGAEVRLIAVEVDGAIERGAVTVHRRAFEPRDVEGAFLVVIATDDPSVNATAAEAAEGAGALVNRADDPPSGDLHWMASHRDGPLTVAVHTGGGSATAAKRLRDVAAGAIDPAWPTLLAEAATARQAAFRAIGDPARRRGVLLRLADDEAMAILQTRGLEALRDHHRGLMPPDDDRT